MILDYLIFGAWVPLVVLTLFWYVMFQKVLARACGVDNKEVRLEMGVQKFILPTLIIFLVQLITYGLLWVFYNVSLVYAVVPLIFLYLLLTVNVFKFVLLKLEKMDTMVQENKKNKYLDASTTLDKKYLYVTLLNIVMIFVIPLAFHYIPIFDFLGIILLFVYLFYVQNIYLADKYVNEYLKKV